MDEKFLLKGLCDVLKPYNILCYMKNSVNYYVLRMCMHAYISLNDLPHVLIPVGCEPGVGHRRSPPKYKGGYSKPPSFEPYKVKNCNKFYYTHM